MLLPPWCEGLAHPVGPCSIPRQVVCAILRNVSDFDTSARLGRAFGPGRATMEGVLVGEPEGGEPMPEQPSMDESSIERALRDILVPLDRHLERGNTFLAAAL